jgi:creatinine amidohydrolase
VPDPDSTTFEIEREAPDTAVLGVGSFEQHSLHLPLQTDFLFAAWISAEVARELGAMLLNPLPYSTSLEHTGFAGTVTLRPDTLKSVIWDIAASTARWQVRYLVLLNAHGGNFILVPTAREWNMDGRLPHLLLIDFYTGLEGMGQNVHAGEVETSMMLYLHPQRVGPERPPDFVPSWTRTDLTHLGMRAMSARGVWGYPSRANAEQGERWLRQAVAYSVGRVQELKAFLERGPSAGHGRSKNP